MRNDWSFEESGQYSTLAPVSEIYQKYLTNSRSHDKNPKYNPKSITNVSEISVLTYSSTSLTCAYTFNPNRGSTAFNLCNK